MTIIREWFGTSRLDEFRIVPLGDMHIGNRSADRYEKSLRRLVKEIAREENSYVVLMGDVIEAIGVKDKRFDPKSISKWIALGDLVDIAAVQNSRAVDILMPVIEEDKIIAVLTGNHEQSQMRWHERDVSYDIIKEIKRGGSKQQKLGLGMSGWVMLRFHRNQKGAKGSTQTFKIFIHHGFVGGRLAGAKALNMQRLLWNHQADLVLMGHDHTTRVQPEAIERLNMKGDVEVVSRLGCSTGNWLGQAKYAREAGYFPIPVGYVDIRLRPGARKRRDKIRATAVTW